MNGYPDTRKEAQEIGSKYYDTGKPCKHGHHSLRYTSGQCVECVKEASNRQWQETKANETPQQREWRLRRMEWRNMMNRCYNPNFTQYKDYGGRGIEVEEYLWVFENFADYIGPRPSENHEINRIDNDGHYERGNIEWTTSSVNNYNRRKQENNTSGFTGIHWDGAKGKWKVYIGVDGKQKHIGLYDTLYEAQLARREAEIQYWGKGMVKTPHPDHG